MYINWIVAEKVIPMYKYFRMYFSFKGVGGAVIVGSIPSQRDTQ